MPELKDHLAAIHAKELSSPLAEALKNRELSFVVRNIGNTGYRKSVILLDDALAQVENPEEDPAYGDFLEFLCLVLHKGEMLLQADAVLDMVKEHHRARGGQLSASLLDVEKSLKDSILYRLQNTMDSEYTGLDIS